MKRLLTLTMLLAVLAYGAGLAQAANLLANPDMDHSGGLSQLNPTPLSWTASSSKSATGVFNDGLDSEGFANVLQPLGDCSGSGCGIFFKPFQGSLLDATLTPPGPNLVSSIISQDVAGSAGNYTLTGWAGAEANYVGLSDPTVKSQFVLQFLNASSSMIGSSTINLNTMGLGTAGLGSFNYRQFSVSGTAPAGTATVRSIAQMLSAYNNPLGGGQAFVVDSFDLEKSVPEPASIVLGLIAAVGVFGLARRQR